MGRTPRVLAVCLAAALVAAGGAAANVLRFPRPKAHTVKPVSRCSSELVRIVGGSPTTKTVPAPGRPGLAAVGVSQRAIKVHWQVAGAARCRTTQLWLSVGRYGNPWRPTTVAVRTKGRANGTVTIRTSKRLPAPNVAIASAFTREGGRSVLAAVLVRR